MKILWREKEYNIELTVQIRVKMQLGEERNKDKWLGWIFNLRLYLLNKMPEF